MKALVQRVTEASVTVGAETTGSIGPGLLILLGVSGEDGAEDARWLAAKCASLRIFDDAGGKMNLSVKQTGGEVLVISQFTLYGDAARGARPSYTGAAHSTLAEDLYGEFLAALRKEIGAERVQSGLFRAMMKVRLVNDGPVTLMVESGRKK
ncbi:MAG TPA: D-aminoacyl-tRNA deacylase [Bacteroidota bacterium]|nr:D-aminoacyl-tRNA deacylase [Bacteroidota bacterium]